jgi:5-methylcytosine-specific restriction endonuclease McrA
MKKNCPKCEGEHEKDGPFCSRKCANSRDFTAETRKKKSDSAKRYAAANKDKLKRIAAARWKDTEKQLAFREAMKQKSKRYIFDTPFEQLGPDSIRKKIIFEQEGKCNNCGIYEWLGKLITLEIDHKDGEKKNNARENLEGLCPNCHSQTKTWRGRNKRGHDSNYGKISDERLLQALTNESSIRQALLSVGLAGVGNNYIRAKRLLGIILV